jgi:nucleotide-binding universal stress UspA family protein
MYNHILLSTDGSEVAQKGVDHGLSLAKKLGARVTIITGSRNGSLSPCISGSPVDTFLGHQKWPCMRPVKRK